MGPWGALLRRELLSRMRPGSHFVMRTVYVGVLFLLILVLGEKVFLGSLGEPVSFAPGIGQILFNAFSYAQFGLMLMLVPLISAGAVVEERVEGSLELLLLTQLSPFQIATGKFLSRLGLVGLLVLSNVPVLFFSALLGGVEPVDVLRVFCVTLGMTAMMTGGTLALSAFCRSTVRAAMWSSLSVVTLTASLLALIWVDTGWLMPWHPMLVLFMVLAEPLNAAPWWWVVTLVNIGLGVLGVSVTAVLLRWDARRARLFSAPSATMLHGGAGAVWNNPIVWRAWARQGRFVRWLMFGLVIGSLNGAAVMFVGHDGEELVVIGLVIIFVTMILMCLAVGANLFAQEKREQTLDLLRLTRLRPWEVIAGKLVSVLRLVLVILAVILPGLVALVLVGEMEPVGIVLVALAFVLVGFFVGSLSMFYSLVSSTPMRAALPSVGLVFYVATPCYLWPALVFQHDDLLLLCFLIGWSLLFVPPLVLMARARPAALRSGVLFVGVWAVTTIGASTLLEEVSFAFGPNLFFVLVGSILMSMDGAMVDHGPFMAIIPGAFQIFGAMLFYQWSSATLFDSRLDDLGSAEEGDPALAALLSALVPGAGQIYLGQTMRGGVIMALSLLFLCCAGVANIAAAVDAHRSAQKLRDVRRSRVGARLAEGPAEFAGGESSVDG